MLDDVNGRDAVEAIIGKRIWEFVQIDQHVGLARRIAVDADRAGLLANATADVEHQYRHVAAARRWRVHHSRRGAL